MDRRLMLMAMGASGLGASMASALAQPAAMEMGAAEKDHARRTAAVGTIALQTSDIALGKATNAKVKQFAQFEHDEQTTVAEILKSIDSGLQVAPETNMTDTVSKLRSMPAGPAFDKAFVNGQTEGHQMLLKIQEDYLASGKNIVHVAVAKLVRGVVKEHLVLLSDLSKMA